MFVKPDCGLSRLHQMPAVSNLCMYATSETMSRSGCVKVGALEEEREALAQHLEHMQQALDAAKAQGVSPALHHSKFPATFLSPATRCSCCRNSLACFLFQQTSLLRVARVLFKGVLRQYHNLCGIWHD